MIHSMTGFASASGEITNTLIHLELRAVNHRYLDIQFKLPEELRYLETILRERLSAKVWRGKVECRVNTQSISTQSSELNYNPELVAHLAKINQTLLGQYSNLSPLSIAEILKFPGVLSDTATDQDSLTTGTIDLFDSALNEFCSSRAREGEKLKEHMQERLTKMLGIISKLEETLPSLIEQYLTKVQTRLKEALENIEDDRIKQEFVIFTQKSDVDEELSRLKAHISETNRTLDQKGSIGKRLDFLMQELNREANTLGSKSIAAESTLASVELKVLIEQMREQVQNIE